MGFEPTIPFWGILPFQGSAFDHSANSPQAFIIITRSILRLVLIVAVSLLSEKARQKF